MLAANPVALAAIVPRKPRRSIVMWSGEPQKVFLSMILPPKG
jgi:hypothetical protein